MQRGGEAIPMPNGGAVFETEGPWEDYATPSRDMRVLIAVHTLLRLPEPVRRGPGPLHLGRTADGRAAGRASGRDERGAGGLAPDPRRGPARPHGERPGRVAHPLAAIGKTAPDRGRGARTARRAVDAPGEGARTSNMRPRRGADHGP